MTPLSRIGLSFADVQRLAARYASVNTTPQQPATAPSNKGVIIGRKPVTEEQRKAIIADKGSGLSLLMAGVKHGVSRTTVYNIWRAAK